MALVILPASIGALPGGQPLGVRPGALARDLAVAWSSAAPFLNLANGRPFVLTAGASPLERGLTIRGPGVYAPATGYVLQQSAVTALSSKTEFSALVVCAPLNDGSSHFALSLGDGLAGSGNYILFGHESSSGQKASLRVFVGSYQDLLGATALAPQNLTFANHVQVLGMTNSVTRNVRQVWVDGVLDNASTGLTSGAAHHNVVTLLANSNSGAQWMGGPVLAIYIWNRSLSAEEMIQASAVPFALMRYAARRLYTSNVAGSAARRVIFFAT